MISIARRLASTGSVVPAAIASRTAVRARKSRGASARSVALRCWLRELSARPSDSRTVGTPVIVTGTFRSATIRRTIASCCASFSPKYATSGCTISSSFNTTVATPSKWPGRNAPHRCPAMRPTRTVQSGGCGYITAGVGANTTSTPNRPHSARSASKGRG